MSTPRVYLDHVASTPLCPEAREAMGPLLDTFANPASPHLEGRAAKDTLEEARSRAAAALGCRPREFLFTASGTEALAIGLRGAAYAAAAGGRRRVVVSALEHAAVLESAKALAEEGFEVVGVPLDSTGGLSTDSFLEAAGQETAVAALTLANHEMGALLPVAEIAGALRARRIPLLCDAVLGPGRLPVGIAEVGADLMAFSARKCGGPGGAGALYIRRGVHLARWLRGGLQEERLRPGSENVPAYAGFAAALESACAQQPARSANYRALIDLFLEGLSDLPDWTRVGRAEATLPGLLTLEINEVEGEAAMINMDLEGFAVSTGSTCALGSSDPSPGLLAMGYSKRRASSTLRISVGENVSTTHMTRAASTLCTIVSRLRRLAHR